MKTELTSPTSGHFFASNVREWRTSDNVAELIDVMKKYKAQFVLFYVPLPMDAEIGRAHV